MAGSRSGRFVHAQSRVWVPPTLDRKGISKWMGRGKTTKTGNIGESSWLHLPGVNCQVRIPESMVVDSDSEAQIWTYLYLQCYSIWEITVTPYYTAANGLTEWGQRSIATALSKLTVYSIELKEIFIDHQPAVHWPEEPTSNVQLDICQFALCSAQMQYFWHSRSKNHGILPTGLRKWMIPSYW